MLLSSEATAIEGIVHQSKDWVLVAAHVVPRAARNEIVGIHGQPLKIRVCAPPVGGAANAVVIAIIAKTLGVPQNQVRIISGHTARHKVMAVSGLSRDVVQHRLAKSLTEKD